MAIRRPVERGQGPRTVGLLLPAVKFDAQRYRLLLFRCMWKQIRTADMDVLAELWSGTDKERQGCLT